ncbi:hypothetical protein [Pseudoduganella rhizocola]|uniref:hypothetical protein n=1 Tax=Pseudoduganella rhizocola TaxID=3382643 RepID=UPI0038B555DB
MTTAKLSFTMVYRPLFITLLGAFAISADTHAQMDAERLTPAGSDLAPQINSATRFSQIPFDEHLQALPDFKGNSCEQLLIPLRALNGAKGEYETSAAYAQRLEQIRTANLAGSITASSIVSFEATRHASISSEYDADAKVLSVYFSMSPSSEIMSGGQSIASAVIDLLERNVDSYVAENIYGRKSDVTRTRAKVCAIGFKNLKFEPGRAEIHMQIEADKAPAARKNLGLIYVGQLSAPYLLKYSYSQAPTVSLPVDFEAVGDVIMLQLKKAYLYDRQTGEIHRVADYK